MQAAVGNDACAICDSTETVVARPRVHLHREPRDAEEERDRDACHQRERLRRVLGLRALERADAVRDRLDAGQRGRSRCERAQQRRRASPFRFPRRRDEARWPAGRFRPRISRCPSRASRTSRARSRTSAAQTAVRIRGRRAGSRASAARRKRGTATRGSGWSDGAADVIARIPAATETATVRM